MLSTPWLAAFEFTYEEAVKTLTRYLEYEGHHGAVAKSYREFQKGYFLVLATLELSS
ncbi:hypothetical protein [Piscirickettsia salmonis]|uniref:Nucleotidyltransferase substrate-binding, HI0074 family protein n=1 Tax=Piscirickettsia salmonis TaxID=1238 RepID=A0AAC8ZQC9_PISSA|nr:hypothetical protein [Piscirickettsia salmonis]ALB24569.1 nucleotidyltransferase substrate-binding, HI0074 family protein [Piscirickettsia salmonis]QHS27584.1 hypothetical protein GW538_16985 [Piscirickettsia salmonis]QHS30759.1 hypothetical protein GW537_16855 [Piscirickettsia salmonis]QHS30786.1 hypothetical protein GW537_17115 [Piscirickettsia salmonis]QHS31121.1 hypothetical protein GW537_19235 [Piscirickettsia salmonis]